MALAMLPLVPILALTGAAVSKVSVIKAFATRNAHFQMYINRTRDEQIIYAKAGAMVRQALANIRTVTAFNGLKQETKR